MVNNVKNEINTLFVDARCREVLYTLNTDKLFFGMRVYPYIDGDKALKIIGEDKDPNIKYYYVEVDSKLLDPMLALTEKELTAMVLHEIGHIVFDTGSYDEVKKHIDMYFVNTDDTLLLTKDVHYKQIIAYALKDSVMKTGSLFAKIGNEEIVADTFVASCGYEEYLLSAFNKLLRSNAYINKTVDDRFIALSWTLRLYKEMKIKRLPAIKTLNKAKQLSASQLEKRELSSVINDLNKVEDIQHEAFGGAGTIISNKLRSFKVNGIKSIKNDIYEFNLNLRTIETEDDAILLIRNINRDISILEDYMEEPQVTDKERESISQCLEEMYEIRLKASKEANIRSKYSSMINVVYPDMN